MKTLFLALILFFSSNALAETTIEMSEEAVLVDILPSVIADEEMGMISSVYKGNRREALIALGYIITSVTFNCNHKGQSDNATVVLTFKKEHHTVPDMLVALGSVPRSKVLSEYCSN